MITAREPDTEGTVADILIQRRRQRKLWPWMLGLLALALLPLPFLRDGRADRPTLRAATARRDTTAVADTTASGTLFSRDSVVSQTDQRTTATAAGALAPVAVDSSPAVTTPTPGRAAPTSEFDRYIAANDPRPDDREYRQFAAGGLRRLADELRPLGASRVGLSAIRANADSLNMSGTRASAHPDHARAAFLGAVRELDVLRGRYRAAVDTGRLRAAAWSIDPQQPLLAQRGRVQTFFEHARDALRALSVASGARPRNDRSDPGK